MDISRLDGADHRLDTGCRLTRLRRAVVMLKGCRASDLQRRPQHSSARRSDQRQRSAERHSPHRSTREQKGSAARVVGIRTDESAHLRGEPREFASMLD
jgi:hypothetical protein